MPGNSISYFCIDPGPESALGFLLLAFIDWVLYQKNETSKRISCQLQTHQRGRCGQQGNPLCFPPFPVLPNCICIRIPPFCLPSHSHNLANGPARAPFCLSLSPGAGAKESSMPCPSFTATKLVQSQSYVQKWNYSMTYRRPPVQVNYWFQQCLAFIWIHKLNHVLY